MLAGERLNESDAVPSHLGCSPPRRLREESPWLQSGGPRNPWASLSAARFRVEGQLRMAPHGGQEAPSDEAASSVEIASRARSRGLAPRGFRHPCRPMPTTERLVLRSWRPSDRAPFARLNADPEVVRFLNDGVPFTRAQSDELFDAIQAHWDAARVRPVVRRRARGPRRVPGLRRAGGALVPAVGAARGRGRLAPGPSGVGTRPGDRGRASVCCATPSRTLGLEAVISIIDPDNERSIRVAEKLGMRRGADHVHPRTRRRLLAYEISSHDAAFSPGPS